MMYNSDIMSMWSPIIAQAPDIKEGDIDIPHDRALLNQLPNPYDHDNGSSPSQFHPLFLQEGREGSVNEPEPEGEQGSVAPGGLRRDRPIDIIAIHGNRHILELKILPHRQGYYIRVYQDGVEIWNSCDATAATMQR